MAEGTDKDNLVTKEGLPFGPRRLIFGPGHTDELFVSGILPRDSKYVYDIQVPNPKKRSETISARAASVPTSVLLENDIVKNNLTVHIPDNQRSTNTILLDGKSGQDVLVHILNAEFNSDDYFHDVLSYLTQLGEMPFAFINKKLADPNTKLGIKHMRAVASQAILNKLPNQKSEIRDQLQESINKELGKSLESKIAIVDKAVDILKQQDESNYEE